MATLVPSRLRWRVDETKPVTCLTEVSVALMSRSTSSRCLAGSTVKMLMSVRSLLSLDIVGMKPRLGEWDWQPPNGSRLSCGRNGCWRKAVERQTKRQAGEATQFFH